MEYHPAANGVAVAPAPNGHVNVNGGGAMMEGGDSNPKTEYPPPAGHPSVLNPPKRGQLKWLTAEQVKSFDDTGVLVIKAEDIWTSDELKLLVASVDFMEGWADAPGKYMKYYEKKRDPKGQIIQPEEKILCRMENFTQYNPGLDFILAGQKLLGMCSELFGEPSLLYKEKINYKLPGGDGFAPHQDVAAGWWMYGQTLHISTLICIDEANAENGCLELTYGDHKRGLLSPPWKEVPQDVVAGLKWHPAPTKTGDVVFFDSFVPHRSGPNTSNKPRRVAYATYAKASEGDFRDRYYADKRLSYPPDCERDPAKSYAYKI